MRVVCDIEVYSNFFSCTSLSFDGEEIEVFEISERVNDLERFVAWIGGVTYMITFNGTHYDSPIIMYLVKNVKNLMKENWSSVCERIKSLSNTIIDDDGSNYKSYSSYKYPTYCQVDLFMYWSKLTRVSRKLSLKSFAINIMWPRIQELPIHHTALVTTDQMDMLLDYNLNDCRVTKALAIKMRKDINLRVAARARYGFQCLSWDGVKLGLNILVKRYCDRTGQDMRDVNALRTHRAQVAIGEILLPVIGFGVADHTYIQFVEKGSLITQFKSFYGLWKYLGGLVVTDLKSINCRVMVEGVRYDIKSGGLHTYHNASVVVCRPGWLYKDKDVSSYYPSFGEAWDIGPEHLGPEFTEELGLVKGERIELKHQGLGKSPDAELLKLSLNGGFFGNLANEYTPMLDLKAFLKITINGQLALLMLCEKLIALGAIIDMCNTDGVTIMYPQELHGAVEAICDEWQAMMRMELETVKYNKVVRKDINNYLAFYEGGVKEKGMFLTDPAIDMSRDFLVISKAIRAYFEHGTPVEEFIRNHKEIYDFCGSLKCDKVYTVFWNGTPQQHLNRYFVTKGGAYLYKSKDGINMNHMLKGNTVQLFNNYYEAPWEEYNVEYNYYISECKAIINELEPVQTSLFG